MEVPRSAYGGIGVLLALERHAEVDHQTDVVRLGETMQVNLRGVRECGRTQQQTVLDGRAAGGSALPRGDCYACRGVSLGIFGF